MTKFLFALAAASLTLSACANSLQLNPQAADDVNAALAQVCPLVTVVQPYLDQFNGNVTKAYNIVASACPPNPPPTNAIVAAADLFAAYEVLKPYTKQQSASRK
jgi:hypothetical protein